MSFFCRLPKASCPESRSPHLPLQCSDRGWAGKMSADRMQDEHRCSDLDREVILYKQIRMRYEPL